MYVNSMLIVMEKSLPAKGFLVYKCKKKEFKFAERAFGV